MKRTLKLITCFAASVTLLSSCSHIFGPGSDHEERLKAIVPDIKCGLIYKTNNFIYKDSQEEHVIDGHIIDCVVNCYPDFKQCYVLNCFTKNNLLFSATKITNQDNSVEYSLDMTNTNNWEVTHFYSFTPQEVFERFLYDVDEETALKSYFSCYDGLCDARNIDYSFFVSGSSSFDSFEFEIIFDINDFHVLAFMETPTGIDEEEVCLKRTGASIITTSGEHYLEIDGAKYDFRDSYLLEHSDYFKDIKNIYRGETFPISYRRVENNIYIITSPVGMINGAYNIIIFKVDIKEKRANYLGYFGRYSEFIGVFYL